MFIFNGTRRLILYIISKFRTFRETRASRENDERYWSIKRYDTLYTIQVLVREVKVRRYF